MFILENNQSYQSGIFVKQIKPDTTLSLRQKVKDLACSQDISPMNNKISNRLLATKQKKPCSSVDFDKQLSTVNGSEMNLSATSSEKSNSRNGGKREKKEETHHGFFDPTTMNRSLNQAEETIYSSIINPNNKLRANILDKVHVRKPQIRLSPQKLKKLNQYFLEKSYNWQFKEDQNE